MTDKNLDTWLKILSECSFDQWPSIVANDVRMSFPYAPSEFSREMRGYDQCLEEIQAFMRLFLSWEWQDIEIFECKNTDLFFGTATCTALTQWGTQYGNNYVFKAQFSDGMLLEYTEYFDPLPSLELIKQMHESQTSDIT
jgi:uncharacterized protein